MGKSSEKKPPVKCSKTAYCRPCHAYSAIHAHHGLKILNFVNMSTGQRTRDLLVLLVSKAERPHALNFCPFCGFDFSKRPDWPEFEEVKPSKKPGKSSSPV